jgi:hypothetical protein
MKQKNDEILKYIQFSIYAAGSSISLIFLVIMMNHYLKLKKKGIIVNCLIIITLSEIINCFHKLINFLKGEDNSRQKIICEIQITIGVFSDLCTPLMSLIMSREINHLIFYNELSTFGKKSPYIIYLLAFILPAILSIIFLIIQMKYYELGEKDDGLQYAFYLKDPLIYFVIIIVWIFLIFSFYYTCSSCNVIRQKSKEYLELEQELVSENDEGSLIIEGQDKTTSKLNKIQKNLMYPSFIIFAWVISTVTRLCFIIIKENKHKQFFIINAFLYSFRGFFYYLAYFSCNCLLCCFGNEKQNNKKVNSLTPSEQNSIHINLKNNIRNNDDDGPYKNDEDENVSQVTLNYE